MAKGSVWDAGRSFDATSLTASYQDLGAVMASPVLGFVIYNTSDVDVQLSFDDGSSDGPILPAGGTMDASRTNQDRNNGDGLFELPKNAQVQVKQITGAGTEGDIIMNVKRL